MVYSDCFVYGFKKDEKYYILKLHIDHFRAIERFLGLIEVHRRTVIDKLCDLFYKVDWVDELDTSQADVGKLLFAYDLCRLIGSFDYFSVLSDKLRSEGLIENRGDKIIAKNEISDIGLDWMFAIIIDMDAKKYVNYKRSETIFF